MKKYYQLNRNHRYQIERFLQEGKAITRIAQIIGVHRSTIYREIKRNKCKNGRYKGRDAWSKAKLSRSREGFRYKIKGWVEERILDGLNMRWSPEIISKRLELDTGFNISHEAIYKYILRDRKHGGKLYQCLLRKGRKRQKRFSHNKRFLAECEPRRPISARTIEADERLEVGHWERDLMLSKYRKGGLLVLIDRKSRKVIIERVKSTKAEESLKGTIKAFSKCRNLPVLSITNDNGVEFSKHKSLEGKMSTKVFFADPYASWQRGSVENIIGIIRKFIPKGTDVHEISNNDLQFLEDHLNNKPLRVLEYWTPNEFLEKKKTRIFKRKRHYKYNPFADPNLKI